MTQEEIMAEIFGTVQIPPEADFVPRWSSRLPDRVVELLDGITADNALPDMNRWNAVADALADSGRIGETRSGPLFFTGRGRLNLRRLGRHFCRYPLAIKQLK